MKEYKIDDICSVKSSKRIYARDYVESGIPFFRGKEITEMSLNKSISEVLYISEERFTEIDNKFGSPKVGDILMTAVGTIGNVWEVEYTPIYFKDGNIIWFTDFNQKLINPKYLKILFNSSWFQMLLFNKGSIGSVQSALTIEKVKRINIPIPSLSVQFSIVEKMSRLSDLYKKNYELIADIEEYSQLLFHKWFVDFNFPDELGNPYKDSGGEMVEVDGKMIPKRWKIEPINSFVDKTITGEWGYDNFEEGLNESLCIRGADLPNWKVGKVNRTPRRYIDIEKNNEKILRHGDIMIEISGGSPNQSTGRVLLIQESILQSAGLPVFCTNFSKIIRPKNTEYGLYLGLHLQKLYDRGVFFHFEGKTSGLKNLLLNSVLDKLPIYSPDELILNRFIILVKPLYKKINSLGEQNMLLEETRDLLIKKLIK